jgi:copper transport protein
MIVLLVLLLIWMAAGARPALAHAIVVRTEPADGAVLGTPPRQVRLWFSEPVALHLTAIELIDGGGRRFAATSVRGNAASLAAAVRSDQLTAAEVLIELPSLPPGVYRLSWRTLSSADLHNTAGTIVFGVQRNIAGTSAAATEPLPALPEVALRWLDLGALSGLLGALALALLALPRAARMKIVSIAALEHMATLRRRLLAMAEWAGIGALLAGLGLLLAQALAVGGSLAGGLASAWEIMIGTGYGMAWLARQVALALLLASLTLTRQRPGQLDQRRFAGPRAAAPLLLALAVAVAQALQSHAAAARELPWLAVAAGAAHILAAGVWGGGLLALAVVVLPLAQSNGAAALGWSMLRGFGRLAAASLAALLISGLLLVAQQVASVDALLATLYGRALMLKLALAAGAALLGLLNAARLHARVASALARLLRRPAGWLPLTDTSVLALVRLELAGALLVVGLAGLLGSSQPARGPEFDRPAAEAAPLSNTSRADDLLVTLALRPNRPGQNFIALGVFDTRRPTPAPIDQVLVDLRPADGRPGGHSLVASALGQGRYEVADDAITSPGDWTIAVTVRRAGMPDATTSLPWSVLPPAPPARPTIISNAPLGPWAFGTALLLALALAALWSAQRWRARRFDLAAAGAPLVAEARLRPHPEEAV